MRKITITCKTFNRSCQQLKENERRKNAAENFDILCKHKPGLPMIYFSSE
jgi:hypothetical protein